MPILDRTEDFCEDPEEIRDLIGTSLTQNDLDELKTIRYDLNAEINWSELVRECFPALMLSMEDVLFSGKNAALGKLFRNAQDLLDIDEKGEVRKHFLSLLFLKKFLGLLKTRVKKELDEIPQLSYDEEEDLLEAAILGMRILPEEEEEMASGKKKKRRITSVLEKPQELGACKHRRSSVTYFREKGKEMRREYCKDCKTVLSITEGTEKKKKKKDAPCKHPSAWWVEGQEGKVAQCAEAGCEAIHPHPEKIQWEKYGLEPFGDDPSKDEVIVLNEVMP